METSVKTPNDLLQKILQFVMISTSKLDPEVGVVMGWPTTTTHPAR